MQNGTFENYNLTAKKVETNSFTVFAVEIGEQGRGRSLGRLTVPEGLKPKDLVKIGVTRSGKMRLWDTPEAQPVGYVIRLGNPITYKKGIHRAATTLYSPIEPIVLCEGSGAFGDAGKVGSWQEKILAVPFDWVGYFNGTFYHATYASMNRVPAEDWKDYLDSLPEDYSIKQVETAKGNTFGVPFK